MAQGHHQVSLFVSRVFWLALSYLFTAHAFAGPYELSYGGRIVESSGKPVSGPVTLRVSFFRSLTGSDQVAVALPDYQGVTLQDGIFQISMALSAADFHVVFNGTDQTYIQVEDLTHGVTYPRQKFSAVPYALKVPVDGQSITFNVNGELSLGNGANTLRLPNAAGPVNKVLKSDGAGALIWADDLSGGGAGTITSTEIQDGVITNDDISNTAAIATSKISGLGSAATKNVGTGATDVAAGNHAHVTGDISGLGGLATKSAVGSSDITDGSVTGSDIASGTITDTNISATAAISTSKISGLGSLATKSAVGSSDITDGGITDADINATANISYLKISGLGSAASKNVGTAASDVAAGSHTHTMSQVTDAGALATKSAVSSSDITDGSITLSKLSSTICGANEVLQMNSAGTALNCTAARANVQSIVGDYTIVAADGARVLVQTSAGATMTLPQAALVGNGFNVTIKNNASTFTKVVTQNSETLEATTAAATINPGGSAVFITDGSGWFLKDANDAGISMYKYYRWVMTSADWTSTAKVSEIQMIFDHGVVTNVEAIALNGMTANLTVNDILDFNTTTYISSNVSNGTSPYDVTGTANVTFTLHKATRLLGSRLYLGVTNSGGYTEPDAWYWQASYDDSTWVTIPGSATTTSLNQQYYAHYWNTGY